MEVILAKTAGFCFGVKRAVDMVYQQIGNKNTYTFGPIIHNEEVVRDLREKGIGVINDVDEALKTEPGTIIIRSHGTDYDSYQKLKNAGWNTGIF